MRKIKTHILIFGATGMLGRALGPWLRGDCQKDRGVGADRWAFGDIGYVIGGT